MIRIFATVFTALVGLAFGSFLNVCLTRWPAGESVVRPRSHCRSCGRTLTWWENVPLASWLALRGRCRTCEVLMGWRYPLVELAVGAIWATIMWQTISHLYGLINAVPSPVISFSPGFLIEFFLTILGKMAFTWFLVALAVLDAEHMWLPDSVTLPGIAVGISFSLLWVTPFDSEASLTVPLLQHFLYAVVAALVAAGLVLVIRWTYWLIRRREGMGLGDAKLMAMLGAWLGLSCALLSFAIGIVLAAIAALALLAFPQARQGSVRWSAMKLPLGTFLCIGGIISTLWGQQIIAAYLRCAGL